MTSRIDTQKQGKKILHTRSDKPDLLMDSSGEIYISFWLDELQDNGYIQEWTSQPESFILTTKVTREVDKALKTKIKTIEEAVIPNMSYTADFKIIWTQKGIDSGMVCEFYGREKKKKHQLFYFEGNVTYLEAKPDNLNCKTFDQNGMTKSVRAKIKQVYDKHNVIVELVFHNKLFRETFMPKRYLTGNKSDKLRLIKYTTKSLEEFTKEVKPSVDLKFEL